jgi:predicted nucleotidyltransferase
MTDKHLAIARRVARRFSQLPEVEAVAIAGSQMTNTSGQASDVDVYIYPRTDIPAAARKAIASEFSDRVEIVDFWGQGVEWEDPETGIHVDTIFFTTSWMEDQIDRVLRRHEAWLGYTTAFWHTVRVSQLLFDRNGWFAALQQRAMQDYPEPLVRAIIAQNHPVLRQSASSYLRQLEKAAARGDVVSLNHRIAGLLASYFDILFAINRVPHPGEKRLLTFAETLSPKRPARLREQVEALLHASNGDGITEAVNNLVDSLEVLLRSEGLLD